MAKKTEIIVTLGPSTNKEEDLRKLKDKGVNFVRVNMSHSSLEDMEYFMKLAKKVGIPFVVDSQGSQVRTGDLKENQIKLQENDVVKIYTTEIVGDKEGMCLKPVSVVPQLEIGDLIHIDFDSVTLRISDISTINEGYIIARTITGGTLGKNKAIIVDTSSQKPIVLPTLSEKDYGAIQLGLKYGVGHIAASFMRSGKAVDEVRNATQNTMKIISKVECIDGLENLNEIIDRSDYLLIDRGDLSKEIPIEKIPFTQKIILNRARKKNTGVFVATNLLESMTNNRMPTRAEVHDVINTIIDGATGLALAGETAIGKYPLSCVNMINKLIKHAQLAIDVDEIREKEDAFVNKLEENNYLLDFNMSSSLIPPHGGKLVSRVAKKEYDTSNMPTVVLDDNRQRDVEQIGIGTYSPIEGFMNKNAFQSVVNDMRLPNGLPWPLPIYLDVPENKADELSIGQDVALLDHSGNTMAILHLSEKYTIDKEDTYNKMYGTNDSSHPGVRNIMNIHPIILGGKVTLLQRKKNENKEYEITPKQSRRLFEERGWSKVVGFHTRNVIHKGHEFIQINAMEENNCDGLFVHPVVGKKKTGDFNAKYIIKSYELMNKNHYPKNRVLFGTFSTYSRYAGPREALFTALCRKNFGCSHFIVGRDHTGVGSFYHPKASHNIFDRFPDLGITPVKFDNVFYSEKSQSHVHEMDDDTHEETEKLHVSGTQARKMFESGEKPPEWFMRPEISEMIVGYVNKGEEVFVKE